MRSSQTTSHIGCRRRRYWSLQLGFPATADPPPARTMSLVFGVGVNYAVQDAAAAARLLAPPLLAGVSTDSATLQVQRRRQRPVRLMQPLQQRVHQLLAADPQDDSLRPWQARLATLAAKAVQSVTARVVGRGFLPEKLHQRHL